MSCNVFSILAFICDQIDAKTRDFLWGSTLEKRKIHVVSWKKVTRPKAVGWFSLHSRKAKNQASMANCAWHMLKDNQGDGPWCPNANTWEGLSLAMCLSSMALVRGPA